MYAELGVKKGRKNEHKHGQLEDDVGAIISGRSNELRTWTAESKGGGG